MALPTPTPAASISGYTPVGRRKILWVPTIASTAAPTSAEFTAGTDLSPWIVPSGVAGFSSASNFVDDPRLSNRKVLKVPADINYDDSSIEFVAATSSTDVRQLLTQDLTGYIVPCWEGIVTGGKCSVFPVTVGSQAEQNVDGSSLATIMVAFAITGFPVEQIAVPTA